MAGRIKAEDVTYVRDHSALDDVVSAVGAKTGPGATGGKFWSTASSVTLPQTPQLEELNT